jgi:hypothetical protein
MKEKFIHLALLVASLLYAYRSGRASEQFWEIVAPPIWVVSGIVLWHVVLTSVRLFREIEEEQRSRVVERKSSILTASGSPARLQIHPQPIPFYQAKIIGVAVLFSVLPVGGSYLVWKKSRVPQVPAQNTPPPQGTIVNQRTTGPGSPAVQGVRGDVSITIDQSSSGSEKQQPRSSGQAQKRKAKKQP